MTRWFLVIPTLLALVVLAADVCAADTEAVESEDAKAKATSSEGEKKAESDADAEKDRSGFPSFDKLAKDMDEVRPTGGDDGMIRVFRYDPDDRSKDQTKLLSRIPRKLLDQDVLFATSLSRGRLAGFMWRDQLVRLRLRGGHVILEAPDARYVTEGDSPVYGAIERTYPATILAAMPIVTMVGSDPVVDLGELLTGSVADAPGVRSVNRKLSEIRKIKIFPENVLIDVDLAHKGSNDEFDITGVSYAFRKLPASNSYKPRVADERVGYFHSARQDWATPHTEIETAQRLINRWRLEKLDPSLEVSPPKEPIVFIIEKTVPVQWRRWVKAGIEEWNRAFEPLGYVDAVVVYQQTSSNEFADYDPEDARYNFVRWITIGNSFALAPRRADPRTGQILDADIVIDDGFLRAFQWRGDVMSPPELIAQFGPGYTEFFERYPAFAELMPAGAHSENEHALAMLEEHDHACSLSSGLQHQTAMLAVATGAAPGTRPMPERLLGQLIKKVVTHEVGHTLGLRHNFKGSAWLSLEEVRRRRDHTDQATSASIMDYAPLLFFKGDDLEEVRHLCDPTIGPYDMWAIRYGYASPAKGQSEEQLLKEVGAENTKPEHAYLTDEDSDYLRSPDPLANRWDMSSDPVAWAQTRIDLTRELVDRIDDWAKDADQPAYYLRSIFNTLVMERTRNLGYVARLVGGQTFTRNRREDPNAQPAFSLLPASEQREAIAFLGETLFADALFTFDPALINDMSPIRWKDWTSPSISRLDYPLHEIVLARQTQGLLSLIDPETLQRVYDAELKSSEADKLTVAELLRSVRDEIWSELDATSAEAPTDSKPMISSMRRNLQSQHLAMLLIYAEPGRRLYASPDVHRMARYAVRELSEKIDRVLDGGVEIDFATSAHLYESRSLINRALEAQFQAR